MKIVSFGTQYDDGKNLLTIEAAKATSGGNYLLPSREGAYITYGRRFGGLMPYVTFAQSRHHRPNESDRHPPLRAQIKWTTSLCATFADRSVTPFVFTKMRMC